MDRLFTIVVKDIPTEVVQQTIRDPAHVALYLWLWLRQNPISAYSPDPNENPLTYEAAAACLALEGHNIDQSRFVAGLLELKEAGFIEYSYKGPVEEL